MLLSQMLFSCEKQDDKLEIYLTNNLIESYEGIALENSSLDNSIKSNIENLYGDKIRVDTVFNKLIYSGRFKVNLNDIEKKPFISDSEIIGLDFEKSEIIFKSSVSENIYKSLPKWKNSIVRGRQFVLLHNKQIILEGYLFSSMSSYWSNTYQIHFHKLDNSRQKTIRFNFNDSINFDENHLLNNKKLVSAFLKRNKKLNGL